MVSYGGFMQVIVSGQGMSVGQSLQEYAKEKLAKHVTKYFEQIMSAQVMFHKHSVFFKANIIINDGMGKHLLIKGEADSDDAYTSFDLALVKVEKQLRRYKNRIKNHHKTKASHLMSDALVGTKYIIAPFSEALDQDADYDEEASVDNPIIIAEKPANIEKLTVAEAVMKMDLSALPALVFINQNNNCINIVYHRADGNISWVDTKQSIKI